MVWCSGKRGGKIYTQLSSEESDQDLDDIFIAVEGESRTVQKSGRRRWCGFNVLVLA
jgi:hypothetical protein